jgi:hypothetical protein
MVHEQAIWDAEYNLARIHERVTRARLVAQAAPPRRRGLTRARLGGVLVALGTRLQGTPRPVAAPAPAALLDGGASGAVAK